MSDYHLRDIPPELQSLDLYLGGSRFMAYKYGFSVKQETDFDFYTDYSAENAMYLWSKGFLPTHSKQLSYLDSEVVEIFKRGNVDIVLRKDKQFYFRVFNSISERFYKEFLWKSSAEFGGRTQDIQHIFNALFAAAHANAPIQGA